MASKIRTQARDAVIAAEQWAHTVEMERDVAREEAAELRAALTDVRESIARDIEAGCVHGRILTPDVRVRDMNLCYRCAHATRIARGTP